MNANIAGRKRPWQEQLAEILKENNIRSARIAKGAVRRVGERTLDARHEMLNQTFRDLKKLGMLPSSLYDLKEKHVQAAVDYWVEKELSPATIQNRLTTLRLFSAWIGKAGMIKASKEYVDDPSLVRRSYATSCDRSWSANGVDAKEQIGRILGYDTYVGQQMRLIHAFGLRAREGICFKPHRADKGYYLVITDGTKGGRDRTVPVATDEQRQLIDELKEFVGENINRSLANPNLSLDQAINRFKNVMHKFGITKAEMGVTAHGLRHQYANNRFQALSGYETPVRGGNLGDMPRLISMTSRAALSEELGHSRITITSSYIGSDRSVARSRISP